MSKRISRRIFSYTKIIEEYLTKDEIDDLIMEHYTFINKGEKNAKKIKFYELEWCKYWNKQN